MNDNKKFKGTWLQRSFIIFLGLVLGILLYWLLGFITKDIDSIRGPVRSKVEQKYVQPELLKNQKSLNRKLTVIKQNMANKQRDQQVLKDSTDNLQKTINQLLAIQKLNVERDLTLPEQQQQILLDSQTMFLENQKQYQALNKEIAGLTKRQRQLEKESASVSKKIGRQRVQGRKEFLEVDGFSTDIFVRCLVFYKETHGDILADSLRSVYRCIHKDFACSARVLSP
jgi:hypothetical protein